MKPFSRGIAGDQCTDTCTTDCGHCKGSGLNREQRRRLSTTKFPGSVPVTVSREVPVTILTGADGTQTVIQTETDEPCYGCSCCVLWSTTVDTLRTAMIEHEDGEHATQGDAFGLARRQAAATTFPGCLVCQLTAGEVDFV